MYYWMATVDDALISDFMLRDGFYYLYKNDNDPYKFLGEEAIDKALCYQNLLNTGVPVTLSIREVLLIKDILETNKIYCEKYKLTGTADKLDKAIKKSN